MSAPAAARALIAEDEPLLAAALQQELLRAWPQLQIAASVGDGLSAVQQALALRPDILFLDIRMPGQSGIDAALELARAWPGADSGTGSGADHAADSAANPAAPHPGGQPADEHRAARPFPALVFVTAYDQYAVQAFEAQAIDYLLKPVQPQRLEQTVRKLQAALAGQAPAATQLAALIAQLRQLLAAASTATVTTAATPPGAAPLTLIAASNGKQVDMVPVAQVLYFEAADKYLRVLTATSEYLIRTPLKDLSAQLDPRVFWQIHRGTLVRASAIRAITRDAAGRLQLQLDGRSEKLPVSRLYAHLFKAM